MKTNFHILITRFFSLKFLFFNSFYSNSFAFTNKTTQKFTYFFSCSNALYSDWMCSSLILLVSSSLTIKQYCFLIHLFYSFIQSIVFHELMSCFMIYFSLLYSSLFRLSFSTHGLGLNQNCCLCYNYLICSRFFNEVSF